MDKEVLSFVVEKTHELMNAASCSKEAKASAQTWLDAVGTENEAAATKTYIAELEADIMPVDGLIGFAESEMGAQVFGADKAKEVAAHAKEIKAAGAKYCDCPACAAAEAILERRMTFLNKNNSSDKPYIGHIVYPIRITSKEYPLEMADALFLCSDAGI